MSVFIKKS